MAILGRESRGVARDLEAASCQRPVRGVGERTHVLLSAPTASRRRPNDACCAASALLTVFANPPPSHHESHVTNVTCDACADSGRILSKIYSGARVVDTKLPKFMAYANMVHIAPASSATCRTFLYDVSYTIMQSQASIASSIGRMFLSAGRSRMK